MLKTEPPAANDRVILDRRTLLRSGVLGSGLLAAPLSAQFGRRGFTHGVASGEPSQASVLLWTRYAAAQDTPLSWQVMDADANRRVVAEGNVVASPDSDWCCKAVATGLQPGRFYYYRFIAPDGSVSDEGRTRTLPQGPTERFRVAVFSCSNASFGWFNAYAHAAEDGGFDCTLHLGDYFYEYGPGGYLAPDDIFVGRLAIAPDREAVALADYRLRYASYRNDADLRRLHQLFPMISGWDDHESANDSYAEGAENHDPATEGDWQLRKQAAMRAYREWMPVSDKPWAEYEIGDLATLFRLETRLAARSEPPSLTAVLAGKASAEDAMAALNAFREGTYADPARQLLGQEQEAWLADGLMRSRKAGKTWQILGQQVLMGSLRTPAVLADALTDEVPAYVRRRVTLGALAGRVGLPINMDSWDGYPAARARVFESALAADANLVSLAGDTHNAWAFDLSHRGEKLGVEFGGQSVTSPGFETYLGPLTDRVAAASVAANPGLVYTDTSRRGYMAVEFTPERATAEYRFMATVKKRGTQLSGTHRVHALAGAKATAAG